MSESVRDVIWVVSLVFVLLALLISGAHLRSILSYHPVQTPPSEQNLRIYVARVVLLVPIYAVESWLGLRLTRYRTGLDIFRDCYEAFVIFSFFQFLVEYLGGERLLIQVLQARAQKEHTWYWGSKTGILQYVIIGSCIAVFQAFLMLFDAYDESYYWNSPFLYTTIITNFSQIWAIYCLAVFYLELKPALAPIRPVPKFLLIKAIVFFTWWQAVIISLLHNIGYITTSVSFHDDNIPGGLQDALICVEMFFAAIAFQYAFPVSDFLQRDEETPPLKTVSILKALARAANMMEVMREFELPYRYHKNIPPANAVFTNASFPRESMSIEIPTLKLDESMTETEVEEKKEPY